MSQKIYEPIKTKQTLNRVKEEKMPFDWSINPYRGCTHGCSFCYARAFQSFIGMEANDEFQNHIFMKMNAAEALEQQLSRAVRKAGSVDAAARTIGSVAIGTATDPYQPIEGKEEITRNCLTVLAKYRIPTTITTRSPLILRDLDILREMEIVSVNISINTLDPEVTRKLEPASPLPAKRLEALETLSREGIHAGIFIAPILPCLTDSLRDIAALISSAKNKGAAFAMASLLRLSPDVKHWYLQTLKQHFPAIVPSYLSLYPTTYANRSYAETVMTGVRKLLEQHGLSEGGIKTAPKRKLQEFDTDGQTAEGYPNVPSTQSSIVPEQLTFAF
ncbi:SPL family radical SAM protein [Paenibacillus turpanensis]|uniref:SPL family radical SAM protein n=1 Tax=Paenibacillus turpanensis TaxID=2689078 RepID=UPI001408B89E|nr:radical SAM protein [Paenibacillus turpanensis]